MPTTNIMFNFAPNPQPAPPSAAAAAAAAAAKGKKPAPPPPARGAPVSDATITTALTTPSQDRAEQERKKRLILGGDDNAASAAKREPGQYIAIDCEMVGVGPNGSESVLARVSLVNWHGFTLYDTFVRPAEKVTDYRTWVSGVRPRDVLDAPLFADVQSRVAELIKDRILVGHAIQNDLQALLLSHPFRLIRDTSAYQGLRDLARTKRPGLKTLARIVLGIEIQREGHEHSSVEDARATMAIFKAHKAAWDLSLNRKTADSARALAAASAAAAAADVGSGQDDDDDDDEDEEEEGGKTQQGRNGNKHRKAGDATKSGVPARRPFSSDSHPRKGGDGKRFDRDGPPKRRKVESKANWWTDPL
ncbi:unnamed protein product [Tilletia controversa]|nr:unnamed protein product [Tilletia controversa]CAD6919222.1 unnamed protein product [Tilletia laevis]CAD6978630.1 unnamed protein product [Tilletia controversa]